MKWAACALSSRIISDRDPVEACSDKAMSAVRVPAARRESRNQVTSLTLKRGPWLRRFLRMGLAAEGLLADGDC